jgi:hypothetical protein
LYTFTKEKVEEKPQLEDGLYNGVLLDIKEGLSKRENEMFTLIWKIMHNEYGYFVHDFILPAHPDEYVRSKAKGRISLMAEIMLKAKDNEKVNLIDCQYKRAGLLIRHQLYNDIRYPRIIQIKPPLFSYKEEKSDFKEGVESNILLNNFHEIDDEIPF